MERLPAFRIVRVCSPQSDFMEKPMRTSMMVRRDAAFAGTYVIGTEAALILSTIRGITDVQVENQYVDRAYLSFTWDGGRNKFDFRPDFEQIDQQLKVKGMRRMQ
jgi:hypothetical protein